MPVLKSTIFTIHGQIDIAGTVWESPVFSICGTRLSAGLVMKHSGNVDFQNVDNEVTSEIICIFYFQFICWSLMKPSEKEVLLQNVNNEFTSQMMSPYLFAFVGCPLSPGKHSYRPD